MFAKGRSAEALFITCSDAEHLPLVGTQPELRNAGNVIPAHDKVSGEGAAIEFAVEVLGIKDIVVCGHSQCNAMQELLLPLASKHLPAVTGWLEHAAAH